MLAVVPDTELVAKLLGREVPGLPCLGDALEMSESELVAVGLDPVEAVRVAIVAEIARRHQPADGDPRVLEPKQAVRLLSELRRSVSPRVVLLLLDAGLRVIGRHDACADMHSDEQSPDALVGLAQARGAAAVVVAHNHPQRTRLATTAQDLALSSELRTAGRRRGVEVVDHLIVAPRAWVSHRGLGLLP